MSLINERNRMQELAGIIISESITPEERLEHSVGFILKADDSAKSELLSLEIPEEPNGNSMTKLPEGKMHTTLTSIKSFKPFKQEFKEFVLPEELKIPNAVLGKGKFVYRDEQGKVTYVIPLLNQGEFKNFVDKAYKSLNLENPEPDRFFHITLANNEGGNPFKSIGNVTKSDFE